MHQGYNDAKGFLMDLYVGLCLSCGFYVCQILFVESKDHRGHRDSYWLPVLHCSSASAINHFPANLYTSVSARSLLPFRPFAIPLPLPSPPPTPTCPSAARPSAPAAPALPICTKAESLLGLTNSSLRLLSIVRSASAYVGGPVFSGTTPPPRNPLAAIAYDGTRFIGSTSGSSGVSSPLPRWNRGSPRSRWGGSPNCTLAGGLDERRSWILEKDEVLRWILELSVGDEERWLPEELRKIGLDRGFMCLKEIWKAEAKFSPDGRRSALSCRSGLGFREDGRLLDRELRREVGRLGPRDAGGVSLGEEGSE